MCVCLLVSPNVLMQRSERKCMKGKGEERRKAIVGLYMKRGERGNEMGWDVVLRTRTTAR